MIFRGLVSGCILYIALLLLDVIFQIDTTRLLLNIDFVTHRSTSPFLLELAAHLLVSIIVYTLLYKLYNAKVFYQVMYILLFVLFVILFYVLSNISTTIDFDTSFLSLTIWLIGHLIYLWTVHLLIVHSASNS